MAMKLNEIVQDMDHIQKGTIDDLQVLIKTDHGHRLVSSVKVVRNTVIIETAEYEGKAPKPDRD